VTTGVVSAVNRSINTDDRVFHDFIQTDASINPGNSGGPLLNINGELIGINTAIYAKAQGIGFAIPINKAKRIIADLIQYGHVMQAWIGLVVQDLDSRMAAYLGLQNVNGVVVTQVEEDSPAARAGLESGDLITAMGRRNITSVDDYYAVVRSLSTGETVEFSILRDAVGKRISIQTRTYPRERATELAWRRLGVRVQAVDQRMRRQFRILSDRGVVITEVREGSHLAHIGVAAGDVIVQLDDQTIGTLDEFRDAVIKSRLKSSVLLLVQRDDRVYYLTVRLSP
jgi:S1-C subfamily serine protease